MYKLKYIIKIAALILFLVVVIPIDLIIFAVANSCTSCVSFPQYLASNFSLFNMVVASISGLLVYFRKKK